MTDANRHLDDELRRVSLPESLRAALTPEALFADAAIDQLLATLKLPPGLADRVHAATRAGDAPARNGVVDLTRFSASGIKPARLDRPAAEGAVRRARGGLTMVREAGRVAAALGLAVVLATAGLQLSRALEGPARAAPTSVAAAGSKAVGLGAASTPRSDTSAAIATGSTPSAAPGAGGRVTDMGVGAGQRHEQELAGASANPITPSASDPGMVLPSPPPTSTEPPRVRGAAMRLGLASLPPAMLVVELPRDARRQVPKAAAFNLAFEMAHGESPFVDPAADPSLAIDRPPLTLGTDGFDQRIWGALDRRSQAAASRIRAEELLAAMPPPSELTGPGTEPVRLGIAAVRSGRTLNGRPTIFMEAAAFAGGSPPKRETPLQATLILDQAAAGDPRAWPRICRGLAAVAARLEPRDRVSVVLCGPRPRVALRDAAPAALAAAAVNWEALPAAVSSDLDAAVDAAREAGLLTGNTFVVAHGATLDRCRGRVLELLSRWHRALAQTGGDPLVSAPAEGMRFVVLDSATPPPDSSAGPTFGRTGLDAVAIRRELLRQVTGEDTLVARQCGLEIRFDPQRVAAYRLIGHRQSVVESLADAPPAPLDLHMGEIVRVVYEVVPKEVEALGLATATLSWRTPDGAAARLEAVDRTAGDRAASLPSPQGCELVLAATLGDLAGESAHATKPLATLAALASLADRWQDRGDVTPFGATLIRLIDRQAGNLRGKR